MIFILVPIQYPLSEQKVKCEQQDAYCMYEQTFTSDEGHLHIEWNILNTIFNILIISYMQNLKVALCWNQYNFFQVLLRFADFNIPLLMFIFRFLVKVSVTYIGKLKNGKIFDSNVGQRPFKFRLGNIYRLFCELWFHLKSELTT